MPRTTKPTSRLTGTLPAGPHGRGRGGKEPIVATSTRTRNRVVVAEPEFKSKSDHMRALFASGQSVAQVTKFMNVTYGFAFGVAKRAGYAETAANRRAVRKVTTESDGTVVVQTTVGAIRVQPDGTVIRPKGNRRTTAPQD